MTVTILDGGLGQELLARAPEAPTKLWAAQVMVDHPQIVRAVHDDYFAAGAEVATANTYNLHHDRFRGTPLEGKLPDLHATALSMARASRDAHGSGRIAGSLGPIGWSYRADHAPPAEEAAEIYAELVEFQDAHVDLFIAETLSGVDQARGALMGMKAATKPRWMAVSVDDADGRRLRSGEPVADLLPLIEEFAPDAVLINCSHPEAIAAALPTLASLGLPFGAYANAFTKISAEYTDGATTVDLLPARKDMSPTRYADFAETWAEAGATLIGGCCEIGPAHIAELAKRFHG
ncbi:MAG: homocysteine S-methyltransferase family protein [Pseudomonadota bacterium]